MKIRQGFVSNSSSSSFVCCISGVSFEGYDGEYDCTYAQCAAGHEFEADDFPEVLAYLKEDGDNYEVPKDICPVCNGKAKTLIVTRLKKELKHLGIDIGDLV